MSAINNKPQSDGYAGHHCLQSSDSAVRKKPDSYNVFVNQNSLSLSQQEGKRDWPGYNVQKRAEIRGNQYFDFRGSTAPTLKRWLNEAADEQPFHALTKVPNDRSGRGKL